MRQRRQFRRELQVGTETNGRLIEEEANKRLQQSFYPELRRILCNFRRGIMTLYGVVSSFHVRQIAQELVQGLEGIEIIDNQLVVATKKASPVSGSEVMSDGAGSTGFEEPELRKIPGEGPPLAEKERTPCKGAVNM